MSGVIHSVNVSENGGVPKLPVRAATHRRVVQRTGFEPAIHLGPGPQPGALTTPPPLLRALAELPAYIRMAKNLKEELEQNPQH